MKTAFQSAFEKVRAAVLDGGLLDSGENVLCALSGGADSVALAVFLKELSGELGIGLFAAHLNHGIRGEEADRDEKFCYELCKRLEIPFVSEKADVPDIAKELGTGLEDAARRVRYDFLNRCAKEFGCTRICTAHHADDNIETVLLHMIRGSGLNGLKGIAPVRDNLVRPLLTLRKKELVDALEEKGYSFVFDSTNNDISSTRNYIRHKILPSVYELNESADKTFYRMCRTLEADNEYLDSEAKKIPQDATRDQLKEYHEALLCRYVKLKFEDAYGCGIDNQKITLIVDAIRSGETVKYEIRGNVTAYISHSGLEFVKSDKEPLTDSEMPLDFGENIFLPGGYRILITEAINDVNSFTKVYKKSIMTKVKSGKITLGGKCGVTVRTKRTGDSYVFGKMTRNVRKQLVNYKIPCQKRNGLPVFCVNGEIFLVHGLPIADGYAPKKDDKVTYIVCAEEN